MTSSQKTLTNTRLKSTYQSLHYPGCSIAPVGNQDLEHFESVKIVVDLSLETWNQFIEVILAWYELLKPI
jgi:hypothetical protein